MQSESIKDLCAALSKAQGMIDHAKKDVNNAFFKSKYADLASCIDAAKIALSENGLAVVQTTELFEFGLALKTTLMHSSGQWIAGIYPIEPIKKDPQGFGSALTYARRYTFCAITGVAADDDDGNDASQKQSKEKVIEDQKKLDDFYIALDRCASSADLAAIKPVLSSMTGELKVAGQKEFVKKERELKFVAAKKLRQQAAEIRKAAQYADSGDIKRAEEEKAKALDVQADKLEGKADTTTMPPASNKTDPKQNAFL